MFNSLVCLRNNEAILTKVEFYDCGDFKNFRSWLRNFRRTKPVSFIFLYRKAILRSLFRISFKWIRSSYFKLLFIFNENIKIYTFIEIWLHCLKMKRKQIQISSKKAAKKYIYIVIYLLAMLKKKLIVYIRII